MKSFQITYVGNSTSDCYMSIIQADNITEALELAEIQRDMSTDRVFSITEIIKNK